MFWVIFVMVFDVLLRSSVMVNSILDGVSVVDSSFRFVSMVLIMVMWVELNWWISIVVRSFVVIVFVGKVVIVML